MYTDMSLMESEVRYRQQSVAQMMDVSRQQIRFLRSMRVSLGRMLVTAGTRLSQCREEHETVATMRTVVTSPPWNRQCLRACE